MDGGNKLEATGFYLKPKTVYKYIAKDTHEAYIVNGCNKVHELYQL